MTAREITDHLIDIDDYLKETMMQDVPNPCENWSEAIAEAIEIVKDSRYRSG